MSRIARSRRGPSVSSVRFSGHPLGVVAAEETVDRGAEFAKKRDVPEVQTYDRSGDQAKRIRSISALAGADWIVVDSHHRPDLDVLFHSSVA